jgi:hypothetical protein
VFSKSHAVKLVASIVVAASIAVVGARTAHAQTFITDTLGGNGHAKVASVQGVGMTPSPVSSSPVARSTGSSIGWNDAWIPGVWAAGLLLLAGAAVMRSRQRRLATA